MASPFAIPQEVQRTHPRPQGGPPSAWRGVSDRLSLVKPGIVGLVLATTLAGHWVAAAVAGAGSASPLTALWTLLGTGLTAAGAAALNNYCDRELDRLMARTRSRPLPARRLPAREALALGLGLSALGLALLALLVHPIAAGLALIALLAYVPLYTALKRRTPWAIGVGGVTGALPPLIGWVGATGHLAPEAWALFGLLFLWQLPHFWALALYKRSEYERAGLPVLPLTHGEDVTWGQIVLHTGALLPVALLPYPLGWTGPGYAVVAGLLSLGFLGLAWVGRRRPPGPERDRLARRLFLYSLVYLPLLSLALALGVGASAGSVRGVD